MDYIIKIDGFDARQLLAELKYAAENGGIHSLRVHVSNDRAKFKVNSHMWSPPMGDIDPECSVALQRKQ